MLNQPTLTLPLQTIENGSPKAKDVLDKALKQVGFIPNMYGFMVNSPALLDTYLFGYNQFRTESGFTPVEQEVVFLTISRENGCHYCVSAHSVIADAFSKVPAEVTDAIRNGTEIPDIKLKALNHFTKELLNTRGRPCKTEVAAFIATGYTEAHVLSILLAISVKVLSNYANHLFETPLDDMFRAREWHAACDSSKECNSTKECAV
ncbi:MAG: carboxymuconolactone decarboxylase family protein [Methylotenera sp.]|nr:carboxymuconolactone decarboxylase family protein [Methylotenera sp.]MDD4926862.1 carboxymuconolactone decarboxylase family protein [Methylotenera sp.]